MMVSSTKKSMINVQSKTVQENVNWYYFSGEYIVNNTTESVIRVVRPIGP